MSDVSLENRPPALLVSCAEGGPAIGLVLGARVFGLDEVARYVGGPEPPAPPTTMNDLINDWALWVDPIRRAVSAAADLPSDLGRNLARCRLAAPIPHPRRNPFLIAGNYRAHVVAGERATGVPFTQRTTAIFFTKPTGAIVGPTDDVEYDPRLTSELDYEVELVVVLGKRGRDIDPDHAMDHVWGYTVGNDFSARDIQLVKPTSDLLRGKGMDSFFPTGPGIVPRELAGDYHGWRMRLLVNGEVKQDATPGEMTRDIPEIIANLSRGLTLEAGDMIATGTPSGVLREADNPVWLKDGDEVISEISGIGRLVNRIRSR